MAYCSQANVKSAANRWTDLGTDAVTRCDLAIAQAQTFVEQQTGTFFEQRELTVTTEPISAMQKRLFMPAPVIAITSVTEADVDITTSVLNYGKWLEKNAQASIPWPGEQSAASFWNYQQQSVVIVGTFGVASTPEDITQATAFIAAALLGWVEKSFVDANGLSQAFRDNTMPPWVTQILADRELNAMHLQPFIIVET